MPKETGDILKTCSLFKRCTVNEIENILLPGVKTFTFEANRKLYEEGGMPRGAWVIVEGLVKVFNENTDGKKLIMEIAGPGQVVGYEALLAGMQHKQSAVTMEAVTVLLVAGDDLQFLIQQNQGFAREILRQMAKKMMEEREQALSRQYNPIRQRVAKSLIYLHNASSADRHVPIRTNRRDIAFLSGATRESATRLIKEFEREDVLKIEKGRILIRDSEKLQKIGTMYD